MGRPGKDFCRRGHNKLLTGMREDRSCLVCARGAYKRRCALGRTKEYRLKRDFGLSLEDWNSLFSRQSGLCLGCYTHASQLRRGLFVDHDHKTGKVRGLLCTNCNTAIGLLRENPAIFARLSEYIKRAEPGTEKTCHT